MSNVETYGEFFMIMMELAISSCCLLVAFMAGIVGVGTLIPLQHDWKQRQIIIPVGSLLIAFYFLLVAIAALTLDFPV